MEKIVRSENVLFLECSCGKTTVAKRIGKEYVADDPDWSHGRHGWTCGERFHSSNRAQYGCKVNKFLLKKMMKNDKIY